MGRIAEIIASGTGCSRRKAEAIEYSLMAAGLIIEQKEVVEIKPAKGKKEPETQTSEEEVSEVKTSK
jgi:hypothetical protein